MQPGRFAMVCCQQGAEPRLKEMVAAQGWRLAFSRPGFVSFKCDQPAGAALPQGPLVRTASWSLGRAGGAESGEILPQIERLLGDRTFDQLHVWPRDRAPVGRFDFEPEITPLAAASAEAAYRFLAARERVRAAGPNAVASIGQSVLDVVLVEPNQWMIGTHTATEDPATRWPGAIYPLPRSADLVSRAYLKVAEALAWSGLPIREGDRAVEIGSAPGGAAQRLLELGLRVTGIDPAEMDPRVASHPNFVHLRARGGDLKRRDYSRFSWLLVDSNVPPEKTLTTVETIVTNRRVGIRGMLLTLKLASYELLDQLPDWSRRIESWGYRRVRFRQLASGRREICAAVDQPTANREGG